MTLNYRGKHVSFTGADELEAVLKRLPKAASKRVLRASLIAGGRILAKEAKARAPRLTGGLAKSIIVKATKKTGAASVRVRVGPGRGGAHGHLQEFGNRGIPARPWLRPAFDTAGGKMLAKVRDTLGKRVVAEAKRIAGPFVKSGLAKKRRRRRR